MDNQAHIKKNSEKATLSCCYANASERSVRIVCELNEAFWVFPLVGKAGEIKALWPVNALRLWQNAGWHKYPHSLKIPLNVSAQTGQQALESLCPSRLSISPGPHPYRHFHTNITTYLDTVHKLKSETVWNVFGRRCLLHPAQCIH